MASQQAGHPPALAPAELVSVLVVELRERAAVGVPGEPPERGRWFRAPRVVEQRAPAA